MIKNSNFHFIVFELFDEKFENHLAATHSAGFELFDEKFENHLAATHSAVSHFWPKNVKIKFAFFSLLGIRNLNLHHK